MKSIYSVWLLVTIVCFVACGQINAEEEQGRMENEIALVCMDVQNRTVDSMVILEKSSRSENEMLKDVYALMKQVDEKIIQASQGVLIYTQTKIVIGNRVIHEQNIRILPSQVLNGLESLSRRIQVAERGQPKSADKNRR